MFDYIHGKLTNQTKEHVTIDVSGIGYRVHVPSSTLSRLPTLGKELKLFISFVIREFAHTLYGFLSENERSLFEALLNISGIGPKTAISIIGNLDPELLVEAIIQKDAALLCKVPGIGKKTAERLLVELKETLPLLTSIAPAKNSKGMISHDAISALMNLGYTQLVAQKAVHKVLQETETIDLSTILTLSLKNIK